jgi:hypothetical protein
MIGSFNTLQSALKFASLGLTCPFSQKIDARRADADLFGDFRNRELPLDPGFTEVTSKIALSSQWTDPFNLREMI